MSSRSEQQHRKCHQKGLAKPPWAEEPNRLTKNQSRSYVLIVSRPNLLYPLDMHVQRAALLLDIMSRNRVNQ